jgi:hypothetical protein
LNNLCIKNFIKNFLISFFSCLVAILPISYLFWPGLTSYDTQLQISQALGINPMSNSLGVFMTLLMKFSIFKSSNIFLYLFIQILFISFLCAIGVAILFSTFLPPLLSWKSKFFLFITNITFCLMPPMGLMNIILWKDIPFSWAAFSLACCSVSISYLYLNRLNIDLEKSKIYISIILILSAFSSLIMVIFRLNAPSLIIPIFLLNIFLYYSITKSYKSILMSFLIIIFSFGLQYILNKNFVKKNEQIDFNKAKTLNTMVNNDFGTLLHNGYKVNEKDLRTLNIYIDLQRYIKYTDPHNSYYQYVIPYSKIDDFWLAESKFVEIGRKNLFAHPFEWIKIKINYFFYLIDSTSSYKIPPISEGQSIDVYGVKLDMNSQYSKIRAFYIKLMGQNGGFYYPTKLVWSYWPQFIFEIFLLLAIIFSFFINLDKINRKFRILKSILAIFKIYRFLFIIMILHSLFLFLPFSFFSFTNDYRYFLTSKLFFNINILLLFIFYINNKKINLNFLTNKSS